MTNTTDDKLRATLPQGTSEVLPPELRDAARPGRVSLLIYHQTGVQAISLGEGQRVVVGRDPEVEVPISDQSLSRRHAAFDLLQGEVWVEDLGSTNSTRLGGEKITRVRLERGSEVLLGAVAVSLHVLQPTTAHDVDSHDQFLSALEHEVTRARTFGRGATLLMLAAEGSGASTLEALHAPVVRNHLRPVDRIARYSPTTLEVLLCESDPERAELLATSLRSSASGGADLRCGIAAFPEAGGSAEELLAMCRDALLRTTADHPVHLAQAGEPRFETSDPDGPVARSPGMRELFDTVDRLAHSAIPVLLMGDTGTGKEVVARALHERSERAAAHLACINCGAIPQSLVESVLFGHEKGAFTGASQQNKGLFEEADRSTLLLDEIGELSPSAQAALLRALETQTIRRVGSNREIAVDVRVVAATHRDLEQMCQAGTFRWDLYYRLNVMILKIPPLTERPEDITPLVERFLTQAREAARSAVTGLTPEALGLLHRYRWPGNVRELRNAIERAVVITRGSLITVDDLPERIRRHTEPDRAAAPVQTPAASDSPSAVRGRETAKQLPLDYKSRLHRFEQELIVGALEDAGWNRTEAANGLGMPVRTLSHRMKKLGIEKT